jgi:hypothetical protein
VEHILNLLSVSWTFLKSLDNQWSGRWHDGDGTLSVLYLDFDFNLSSFPCGGGLLDSFSDSLWWQSEWGTLWSKSGSTSDLSSNDLHVDEFDFITLSSFGWHIELLGIY